MTQQYPYYRFKQIQTHNTQDSCWIIIFKSVYDVTKFLNSHPGGKDILIQFAGKDATDEFVDSGHLNYHYVFNLMQKYKIGVLFADEKL